MSAARRGSSSSWQSRSAEGSGRPPTASPASYLPILLVPGDREIMGEHVNAPFARMVGWAYFGLICVMTVAAPILLVVTNGGGG